MKGRSSLVLLISILVLGAFIWAQEVWRGKVPSRESRRVKLFDLNLETLVSLEFQYTNLVVECVKENGVWMTGGSELGLGRADIALVHRVVGGLNLLGKGTTITAEQLKRRGFDDAAYGFAQPSLRITAVDNRGQHVWLVGRDGSLGDMLYIKEGDGEDIFTIFNTLRDMVPTKVDELRDRVAFSVDLASSRRLEVRGPGGFLQLMKGAKGEWQVQQPIIAVADENEVEAFLEKLQAIRIDHFVADNVSDFSVYGLQGEAQQISLGGIDDTSRMLLFGDEIPDRPDFVYARRADDTSVFALTKDVLDLLTFELDHFRNRRVLPLPLKEIDSISISRGTEQLDLSVTEEGGWVVSAPVSWEADVHAVNELLVLWDNAVVVEFDDEGNDVAAEWQYQVGSSHLGQTNTIYILPTQGRKDGLRIRRDDESTVYQLNLQQVPDAAADPLSFKDKQIWRLDVADIQKVSMDGRTADQHAVERQEDGTFVPSGTNGTMYVDSIALEDTLKELEVLTTSNYVTYDPRDLSGYGLDKPAIALHVGLSGTNQLGRVLLIGEETDRGYYAMVQGRDVVFLLDKGVVDTFSKKLLIDHEAEPAESD